MLGQGTQHVMTLANSIIGVSVLAMPYCFQQCGIILATVLLLCCAALTRVACHLLLKSAVLARRRSYELLAFHTFGPAGKFLVEVSMIGFLLGTCVAFFVVMGDLGPTIISEALGFENSASLRRLVLTGLALCVALPLGMLRNVDSLSGISTLSLAFYVCLVAKVAEEAGPPLLAGQWASRLVLWQPSGALRCVPIFAMALSCQAQLFQMYEALPDPSPLKMNQVVKGAVHVCTAVYLCVGFFGYLAFAESPSFSGNLLLSLAPSPASQAIKLGFVLSVALSFPLVVFPCRASIHSMLFRRAHGPHDVSSNHIPEVRFRAITVAVIIVTLGVGMFIPNIELVLGLVGSTIGTVICVVFPALMFMRATTKNTFERLGAQGVLCLGLVVLFVSTYVTLYAADRHEERSNVSPVTMPPVVIPSQIALEKEPILKEAIIMKVTSAPPLAPLVEKRVEPKLPVEDVHVDAGAIRKEEQEMADEGQRRREEEEKKKKLAPALDDTNKLEDGKVEDGEMDRKQEAILKRLEEQQKQQMTILKQQEDILQKLKEHHDNDVKQVENKKDTKKEEVRQELPVLSQKAEEGRKLFNVANGSQPVEPAKDLPKVSKQQSAVVSSGLKTDINSDVNNEAPRNPVVGAVDPVVDLVKERVSKVASVPKDIVAGQPPLPLRKAAHKAADTIDSLLVANIVEKHHPEDAHLPDLGGDNNAAQLPASGIASNNKVESVHAAAVPGDTKAESVQMPDIINNNVEAAHLIDKIGDTAEEKRVKRDVNFPQEECQKASPDR